MAVKLAPNLYRIGNDIVAAYLIEDRKSVV